MTAAFAAYVSLVPFNFTQPSDATLVDAFRRLLETGLASRSNFAGNVLLFSPLGFFGGGALFPAGRRTARHVIGAAAFIASSILLSFTIEFLQVLVPGRTPSLADVTAQTAGMLAGLAGWLIVSGDIHRWAERRAPDRGHDALSFGLMVFAVGRAVAMLLPLDVTLDLGLLAEKYRNGLIVLNPMASSGLTSENLPATLADLALSVPIGVFACLWGMPRGHRRPVVLALFLGLAFVGVIEAAQVFVMSRTADAGDWLVNAVGVATGVFLTPRIVPARFDAAPASSRWMPIAGLAVSLAFYAAYNWSPFDFQLSGEVIGARVSMIFGAPFYSYYQNPELKAVGELVLKIALGVPIGIFLGWWIAASPADYRRVAVVIAFGMTVIFFAAVEAGQILLPTRYPDNTDILLGLMGALAGSGIGRRFDNSHRV